MEKNTTVSFSFFDQALVERVINFTEDQGLQTKENKEVLKQEIKNIYIKLDNELKQNIASQLVGLKEEHLNLVTRVDNVEDVLPAIEKELKKRGFNNGIQIIEKYSTMVKQTRIELERGNMIDRIYYPSQELFALNSDMGKFMNTFTMYNIDGKNDHDDANDSVGMFTSEIVTGKAKPQKARAIARPF